MSFQASYEFLFVGKDENSFLENYSYDLFKDYGDKSGQIFINLEVQNNPADAEEIGGVIFETMQKMFFENMEEEPYNRFESALKSVNSVLNEFKAQKVSGYIGNLNIVIAAIRGDDLFLTQCGDAEAYLIRKRYVSIVSEGLNEEEADNNDIFSSIASGKIEAGDFILFSSTRLIRYISKTDLAQCVNRSSIIETLADIEDIISTEILGRVGLTGVLFENAKKEDIEDIESKVDKATKSILESDQGKSFARRESLTGKFLTLFKRKRRIEVFQGRGRSIFDGFIDWFQGFWGGLFSKGFGKDKILALLILVIVVLTVGIIVANNNQAEKNEIERLDLILQGVQEKVAEADTKGVYDKEGAQEILDKAYLDAKSVLDSGYYREKATLYLLQIEDTRDKLDNVVRVENPTVLADLSAKRSDVNALGFALVGDRVFVFEYNALYEIVLDQIQDPLTIDEEETVIAASGFADRNSVVFLTKTGKLIEYKDGTMSFMDTDDGAFRKGTAIADWSNKIYVLDPTSNQIWRYTYKGTRGKFGTAESYISDATDISTAQDFAIDASVYVLMNNGDVLKYYAGAKQEFYINNSPFNLFKNPSKIYTNEKLDEVYVLDSKDARVLVFMKDTQTGNLTYTSQYLFEGVGDLRDFYVDPDSKKMYILNESKVFEVDL